MNNNWCPFIDNDPVMGISGQIPPCMMPQNQGVPCPYMMQQMQQMQQMQPNQTIQQMLESGVNQDCPCMNMPQSYGMGNLGQINTPNDMGDMADMYDTNVKFDFINANQNAGYVNFLENMDVMDNMDNMDFVDAVATTSDRPAVLSDNPAVTTISLFKELTGYHNYGNPSGNADILYTGTRGTWTFQIPPLILALGNLKAELIIRAVLDDHASVPTNRYSARISINGTNVHTGRVPLEHGRPEGKKFDNWRLLTFTVPNLRRNNRIVIANTSNAGSKDWIGLDWMELRFLQ